MVGRMLKLYPAYDRPVIIREPYTHVGSVIKNRIWYRGEASELEQYFKGTARDNVSRARFWAVTPSNEYVRKMHSGVPAIMAERLADIVVSDLGRIYISDDDQATDTWKMIQEDSDFDGVLNEAIVEALTTGDGAFKIEIDTDVSEYPILSFYAGENVDYQYRSGKLVEIWFYKDYSKRNKDYRLKSIYGKGYITYELYDAEGKEVSLSELEETKDLQRITYPGDFILGEPVKFFKSAKFKNRGKSIYDTKDDAFDMLDEVISQWLEAVRKGRVNKYIPENMIPKDPENGALIPPNPFDNDFVAVEGAMSENDGDKIEVVQPEIRYQAYVETYASCLDMCLMGIMSPATLGIDLKKTDNAESQREKKDATQHTRGKIIDSLSVAVPNLVSVMLKTYDLLRDQAPGEYEAVAEFREYAAPGFGEVVKVVSEATSAGIMSIETSVDELWKDRKDDAWKQEEVLRLKNEQGVAEMDDPPSVGGYDQLMGMDDEEAG